MEDIAFGNVFFFHLSSLLCLRLSFLHLFVNIFFVIVLYPITFSCHSQACETKAAACLLSHQPVLHLYPRH